MSAKKKKASPKKKASAKKASAKKTSVKKASAKKASAKKKPTDVVLEEIRAFGLAYPGAHTKSPWPGHLDLAVNDKTFAYLSIEGQPFGISCKLPQSHVAALMLPFTKPAGYGLGKSGWISATFDDEPPPIEMLKEWIEESYRAQAPKKLVAALDAQRSGKR